ncbi:MAG: HIT domain-containing protein [Polaromonas sp.]|nr:HIT domain-containing protein [Gemmatimonadaceae bacterium]
MTDDCLFCRIVRKEIPATIVLENEHVLAFRDIDPKAPTHVVVVPKVHVPTLDDATDARMLGELQLAAAAIARGEGIVEGGYRTVINCGPDAGQSVFHVHLHLLGGRKLGWPPG